MTDGQARPIDTIIRLLLLLLLFSVEYNVIICNSIREYCVLHSYYTRRGVVTYETRRANRRKIHFSTSAARLGPSTAGLPPFIIIYCYNRHDRIILLSLKLYAF